MNSSTAWLKVKSFLARFWHLFVLPVAGIILNAIINALVSKYISEDDIDNFLNTSINMKKLLPTVIVVVAIIACLIVELIKAKQSKQILKLKPDDQDKLTKVFRRTIDRFSEIESIQAYEYVTKEVRAEKYIIVKFLTGLADERIEINSILQQYLYFKCSTYNNMEKFSKAYRKYTETGYDEANKYKLEYLSLGKELSEKFLKDLNLIDSPKEITKYHFDLYRMLITILTVVQDDAVESVLKNAEVEKILAQKRNGMLGSILLKNTQVFRKNSQTKKRIYFSFPVSFFKDHRDMLLIATINNDPEAQDEHKDIGKLCEQVQKYIFEHFE